MPATTTLLGLVTPTQGTLSGTWGDTVNYGISDYVDISVAGTLTLTNDGAVTLANTTGSSAGSNITSTLTGAGTVTAQFAIVKVTGTLTVAKVVTGPSYSKTYTVVNAATGGIVTFKASGQTGVSVAVGESAFVYFNGTDYVKIVGTATAGAAGGSTTQVQYNNAGVLAGSANMTFNGTTLTVNDLTDSSLTATRVVFAGTAGNLTDSANLTWNGTSLSATQIDITAQGTLRLQDTTGGEYVGLRSPASLGASYTLTFPADDGTSGQALITDGSGGLSWSTAASGDVYGPASATANGIVLFDSTTGKLIKDSAASDGLIYGLTVGRGAGAVATNTAVGASALAANISGTFNTVVGYQAASNSTVSGITAIGYFAAKANTTGDATTAVGNQSLTLNTTGVDNTAVGAGSLYSNTTGSSNTALGRSALLSNTTASNNTAVGYQAGYTTQTATGLSFFGQAAGYSNTTGANNTFVGLASGYKNTTGSNNTGLGYAAFANGGAGVTGSDNMGLGTFTLNVLTSGSYNVAVGNGALQSNTTASNNTAVGYQAGYSNTTGSDIAAVGFGALYSNTNGASNIAMGTYALRYNTGGNFNVGIGVEALRSNTTASNNTAVGHQAGYNNTTASNNTAVGYFAGYTNTTGAVNTYIGYRAGVSATGSYNTFVGSGATDGAGAAITSGAKNTILGGYNGNQGGLDIRTASNYIVLSDGDGNPRGISTDTGAWTFGPSSGDVVNSRSTRASGSSFSLYTGWYSATTPTDGTLSFNVTTNGNVTNTNNSYGSISDVKLKENIVDASPKLADLMQVKVRNYNMIGDTTKQIGVVAQELETVFQSMIDVTPDRDTEGNDLGTTTKSVKYSVFVPMLIKAMQEQQAIIESLKARLDAANL